MRTHYIPLLILVTLLTACSGNTVSDEEERAVSQSPRAASVGSASAKSPGDLPAPMPDGGDSSKQSAEKKEGQPVGQDEQYRQLVVGTWEDDYQGHRIMTLNEDGTGTMLVELSGMTATLFASRLEFNMEWSLEDGRLKKRTIDGKPERRVNMILKMMGDRVDEPIVELTEDRLLLLDKDGETQYDWRRKKNPATPDAAE